MTDAMTRDGFRHADGYRDTYDGNVFVNDDGTKSDSWKPASGGMERPFEKNGKKHLHVFNLARDRHGYLDMGTDMVYMGHPDEEEREVI